MKKAQTLIASIATLALLAACGDRPGERALSGGGIGAGFTKSGGSAERSS